MRNIKNHQQVKCALRAYNGDGHGIGSAGEHVVFVD